MKQYIMGMLTGASLILCAVMFIGASDNNSNYGKYQAFSVDGRGVHMINTLTGELFESFQPRSRFNGEKNKLMFMDYDDGMRRMLDKSWLKLSDRDEMFSPLNKMTEDELKDYNLKMYPPRKK